MNRILIGVPSALALWLAAAAVLTFANAPEVRAQTPAMQVTAGGYHTCAILVTGRAKCWGDNTYGQLGLGDTNNRGDAPGEMGDSLGKINLLVTGPLTQMALGGFHTCALDGSGRAWCWGENSQGQLGYGNTNNLGDNPGEVNGGLSTVTTNVQKIGTGVFHTCALKFGGVVWCWGNNGFGQLGTGDTQNRRDGINNAFAVPSLGTGRRAIDLAVAAYSTCVLLDNQAVKCWGYNGVGTLGLGDTAHRGDNAGEMGDSLPVVNTGHTSVKQLVGGGYHVCAVGGVNTITKCWGYNPAGQLGLGDTNNRGDTPGEMGSALPIIAGYGGITWQLVAGLQHTCVPAHTGFFTGIKCFGYNGYGQLGQGDTLNRGGNPGDLGFSAPPPIDLGLEPSTPLPRAVIGMAAGFNHTCAIVSAGEIKCWGHNGYGQLGLGDTDSRGDAPGEMGDALPSVDL